METVEEKVVQENIEAANSELNAGQVPEEIPVPEKKTRNRRKNQQPEETVSAESVEKFAHAFMVLVRNDGTFSIEPVGQLVEAPPEEGYVYAPGANVYRTLLRDIVDKLDRKIIVDEVRRALAAGLGGNI
jgi:hypothetical protein